MVQRLLSSAEFKMDPLVSLYYFAPACAVMNAVVTAVVELPSLHMSDIYQLGMGTLFLNAAVAFGLNVAVVFLVCLAENEFVSICSLILARLAKPPLSSLLCPEFSRISSSSLPRWSSSATPLLLSRPSDTRSPLVVWFTTSLERTVSTTFWPRCGTSCLVAPAPITRVDCT